MPDRVIRDELITSERWWTCSPEARCLWLGVALSADDAGRYSGAAFPLRTRCMAGTVTDKRIEELLAELVAADLLRSYLVDGRRYLFVPRFRQRQRYVKASRYPTPPKTINDLSENKTDSGQTQDGPKTATSQTEGGPKTRGVGVGVGEILSRRGVGVGDQPPVATDADVRALREADRQATSKPILNNPQGQQQKPNGLPPGVPPDFRSNDASVVPACKAMGITWAKGATFASMRLSIEQRLRTT